MEARPAFLKPGPDLYHMSVVWADVAADLRMDILRRAQGRLAAADPRIKKTLLQFHNG